jgi:hypothetical protein
VVERAEAIVDARRLLVLTGALADLRAKIQYRSLDRRGV